MEIERFIEEVEEQGHQWLADEMWLYHENPEMLRDGGMVPDFDRFDPEEGLPALYFYLGIMFGVGMEKKHDL